MLKSDHLILAGDIGGTKSNLGYFTLKDNHLAPLKIKTFKSNEYSNVGSLVNEFIEGEKLKPESACFGIACPIIEGKCSTPNLPWKIDQKELSSDIGLSKVFLINDLVATGYGVSVLPPESFHVLNPGKSQVGNAALIAAGTGLGEAILFWNGKQWHPSPSEGGHTDFAPTNDLELEMYQYLRKKYDHVSYERVLSGSGLYNIYEYLKETGHVKEQDYIARELQKNDPAVVISRSALQESCPLCIKALDLFISIYGAESGNLALKAMSTGGVYLGGGIAPKILQVLKRTPFMQGFLNKGRMYNLLSDIKVQVIIEQKAALYGAAYYAFMQQHNSP